MINGGLVPRNNKFLAGISLVLTAIFLLAGCGTPLPSSVGGLLTGRTVTAITPAGGGGTVMGGAKQGVPLVLSASVTLLAGSTATFAITDGTGAAAGFKNPVGITTDGTNLYVADPTANNIRKIVIASAAVTTIAGSITGAVGSNDGTGTGAGFQGPRGITTDGTNLYVADTANNLIRKIVISTGVVTTLAGSTAVIGFADGVGTAATFSAPYGITTDGTSLYVTEIGNDTIRKIDIATATVSTLAGSAMLPAGNQNGTGAGALFRAPRGIVTDGTNLYVADTGNNTIRQIVISTAVVTTIAGTGGVGSVNGTGTAASFTAPAGITMDGTSLYISDTGNHIIRKMVLLTANVTTLAGTAGTFGATDGVGTAATFNSPYGITTDGVSLYVAEFGNGIIRKIQ